MCRRLTASVTSRRVNRTFLFFTTQWLNRTLGEYILQTFPEWFVIVGIPIVLFIVITGSKHLANRFSIEDLGVDLHTTGFTFIVATTGIEHPIQTVNQLLSPLKGPVLLIFAIFIALTVGLYGKAQDSQRSKNSCFVLGLLFFIFGLWWAFEYIGLSLLNFLFSLPPILSLFTIIFVAIFLFFTIGMVIYSAIGPKKKKGQ